MPNGFVNLQTQLRAVKNNVKPPFRALLRMMQSNRFLRDATGVLHEFQLFNEFVSFILPLSPKGIGIRALLNLVACEGVRRVARAGGILRLMNVASLRR